jgi:hypothetical protein
MAGAGMDRRIFLIVPWYRLGDYDAAASMFGDMPATYAAWHTVPWSGKNTAGSLQCLCLRVLLRPDEFLAWCRTHQVQPDAEARSTFVVEKARSLLWPDAPANDVV